MMKPYETIFARSFSGEEQKRLGRGALIACCVLSFTLCTVFRPYLISHPFPPASAGNLVQSISTPELNILQSTEEIRQPNHSPVGFNDKLPIIKNLSSSRSQVYELNGDVRIHGNSSTIFLSSIAMHQPYNITTKPYARNGDSIAMRKVRGFQIIAQSSVPPPRCGRSFSLPAVVFSSGGHAGNPFHDFTDVLVPLYLTSRQFNGRVLFLVADRRSWWTSKYKLILDKLSHYEVVDIDNVQEVLCFPRMIVGLRADKELSIDPSTSPHYSVKDLTRFLRSTYSLDRHEVVKISEGCKNDGRRPRLLIVSRKKTRRLTNADEVADLARSLGFDVVVREMGWQVSAVARLVNSFDVMVGVHGAGLTNMVFLPANAVVIQIVPIRVEMLAKHYFQRPAEEMGLRYMEYRVRMNESSLSLQERSQSAHTGGAGWHAFRAVYLDGQDVNVDVIRFRETLSKALELVCG